MQMLNCEYGFLDVKYRAFEHLYPAWHLDCTRRPLVPQILVDDFKQNGLYTILFDRLRGRATQKKPVLHVVSEHTFFLGLLVRTHSPNDGRLSRAEE